MQSKIIQSSNKFYSRVQNCPYFLDLVCILLAPENLNPSKNARTIHYFSVNFSEKLLDRRKRFSARFSRISSKKIVFFQFIQECMKYVLFLRFLWRNEKFCLFLLLFLELKKNLKFKTSNKKIQVKVSISSEE